jgi:hypothetical protein
MPIKSPAPSSPAETGEPVASPLRPKPWWLLFLVVIAANLFISRVFLAEPPVAEIAWSEFQRQVQAGNVAAVAASGLGRCGRGPMRIANKLQR